MNKNQKVTLNDYLTPHNHYFIVKRYYRFRYYNIKEINCFVLDCKKVKKKFTNLDEYTFLLDDFIKTGNLEVEYFGVPILLYNFDTHKEIVYHINKKLYKSYKIITDIYNKLSDEEKNTLS